MRGDPIGIRDFLTPSVSTVCQTCLPALSSLAVATSRMPKVQSTACPHVISTLGTPRCCRSLQWKNKRSASVTAQLWYWYRHPAYQQGLPEPPSQWFEDSLGLDPPEKCSSLKGRRPHQGKQHAEPLDPHQGGPLHRSNATRPPCCSVTVQWFRQLDQPQLELNRSGGHSDSRH